MPKNYFEMLVITSVRTMILVFVTALMFSCGEEEQESVCTLGELQACPCIDSEQGVQQCDEDLQGWGQCQCTTEEDQSEDNGGTDSGGTDSGGMNSAGMDSAGMDSGGMDSGHHGIHVHH